MRTISCVLLAAASLIAAPVSAQEEREVMRPINAFMVAFGQRDAAAMQRQTLPDFVIVSKRGEQIRRLTADQLATIVKGVPGTIAEPLGKPIIHVDRDMATVWVPYTFLKDGIVTHCGTDMFSLFKFDRGWLIAGASDNARQDCG